jgi:hypothetical protein
MQSLNGRRYGVLQMQIATLSCGLAVPWLDQLLFQYGHIIGDLARYVSFVLRWGIPVGLFGVCVSHADFKITLPLGCLVSDIGHGLCKWTMTCLPFGVGVTISLLAIHQLLPAVSSSIPAIRIVPIWLVGTFALIPLIFLIDWLCLALCSLIGTQFRK